MSLSDNISTFLIATRTHKMKVVFSVIAFVFFLVVLFPFDDLSDVVTEKIAQATHDQIFLRFDHLGIAFLPPALEMDNVTLETPFLAAVKASSMTLTPAIGRLLMLQPGVRFSAAALFKGDLTGSVGMVKKNNHDQVEFSTKYKNLDLLTISQFFESQWEVSGKANIVADNGIFDPSLTDPPKAELEVSAENVGLPNTLPANIPILGGTIIPTMKFSDVGVKGRLVNRELIIDESNLGGESDPFRGKVKGKLEVDFRQGPGGIYPQMGGYDLSLNIEMDRSFESDLQKRLPIVYDQITKYKSVTGKGSRYSLRLRSQNPMNPPEVTPIQAF